MNLNITVNESGTAPSEAPATHNVRVHYTEADAGHLSGPFSLSVAQQAAIAAMSRDGVIKATIEEVA